MNNHYLSRVIFLIFVCVVITFIQNAYADENKALSVVEDVRKATNSRNFDALGKLLSNDFEIVITRCNQEPVTQDKHALFEELKGAFDTLEDYIKESRVISTEKQDSKYIVKTVVVEHISIKGKNELLRYESIEEINLIESADEYLVSKILAVQVCE